MKTAFRKFFKLETDFQDEVKLSVLEASKEILEYSGLKIRETDKLNEIEVYFQGIKNAENIKPFPKLAIGETLYFGIEIDKDKLEFKDKIQPSPILGQQIGIFELNGNTIEGNENTFIFKQAETLDIRKTLTLFKYEKSYFAPNQLVQIRNYSEVVIDEIFVTTQEGNGVKKLIFSFDFSKYPMGIYRIVAEGVHNSFSERFFVDKDNDLSGKTALILINYNDKHLKYNVIEKDNFTLFRVHIKP